MDPYENSESVHKLSNFWEHSKIEISNIKTDQMTFKSQDLPLARIKKIMKLDEDVKSMMISAEAPILFAKAAEFFIREITLRAWIHTERNKRRTLQRSDITLAVADGETDQFDFLIDIVPRDEVKPHGSTKREETTHSQPMHQVTGNLNLFNGNTIHLSAQAMTSNHQSLLSGLVDSNNLMQAQVNQNNSGVNNQSQLQYVLQLPPGTTLSGGQTLQIQMMPQQDMNHGTATVVLQPNMLQAGGGQVQMYGQQQQTGQGNTLEQQAGAAASVTTTDGGVGGQTASGQYVMAAIKRDMEEAGGTAAGQEPI